jgi:hypothetical protein
LIRNLRLAMHTRLNRQAPEIRKSIPENRTTLLSPLILSLIIKKQDMYPRNHNHPPTIPYLLTPYPCTNPPAQHQHTNPPNTTPLQRHTPKPARQAPQSQRPTPPYRTPNPKIDISAPCSRLSANGEIRSWRGVKKCLFPPPVPR